MIVKDAIALWLSPGGPSRPVGRGWRTVRGFLVKHLIATIGDVDLETLGPADVWRVQEYCISKGFVNETANKITHAALFGLVRDLEAAGLISPEVRARIRTAKKLRASAVEARHYNVEERDRALTAFAGTTWSPHVHFLFLTGCRVSELCGLREENIDWLAGRISIVRARTRYGVTACKTRRSQRTIAAPAALLREIRPLKGRNPTGYFFPGDGLHSDIFSVESFRRNTWHRVLKAAGLRPLNIHGTRHSFATIALESGVPIAQLAAHLGDTIEVVESRYAHVRPTFDVNSAVGRPVSPPPVTEIVQERRRPVLTLYRGGR